MASREKKPLAPSKAKQKATNDSGLPMNEIKNRKGKPLSNLKQQQLAQDILDAVATGSQLPPKLEATVPRKKVLKTLKRKQNLRVAKVNLIKSKVTRKVANRNLCRIPSDIKKGVRSRRIKLSEENNPRNLENHAIDTESESIETDGSNRSAKNNLRTKKTKGVPKTSAEVENEDILDRDTGVVAGSSTKSSPKLGKKGRSLDNSDPLPRGVKSGKFSGFRRNNIKEKDTCIKTEIDNKYTKGRKSTRDIDYGSTRISKSFLNSRSSIEITIDEVIASMLSDSETENQQEITEKIEGKVTRSKKMLVEENNTIPDVEIKKEPDSEDIKIIEDEENPETESSVQNAIQLRKRSNASAVNQRSLRNGKLRQSESDVSTESEHKKARRLNSDDPINSEVSMDNINDANVDTESSFSESSGNDTQIIALPVKEETTGLKHENLTNFEDNLQPGLEAENNNNGDRLADRGCEIGPTLRSKTKAKSIDETKMDNIKLECGKLSGKNSDVQEEPKKASSVDQARKDNILAKLSDKSKGRRSSLNIDMKKTVNSFYNTEKSDGSPKSQIDQMIENIKLTIAKSIESKIFGPEKGLGLTKNFDVPKMEEIIAPLSAESQKLGLEENTDEDKSTISKNEIKSESTENSVPKVADTAKEIEKLVMGDIELAETHSQNVQESESSDADANDNPRNVPEVGHSTENNDDSKPVEQQEGESSEVPDTSEESEKTMQNDHQKILDDAKKTLPTRRSPRITDKTSPENGESKKSTKSINKTSEKSENCEDSMDNNSDKLEESGSSQAETLENESMKKSPVSEISLTSTAITSDKVTDIIGTEAKTSNTNKEEIKVSSADIVVSDEVETLESISKEVERLVAEEHSSGQPKTNTKEIEDDAANTDTEKQEATSVKMTESEESVETVKNAKDDEELTESASEAVQDSKKNKNNSQATSATESNSKENTVPSDVCSSTEDKKKDMIDTKDSKRRNNDTDKQENKSTSNNDLEYNESTVTEDETEKSVEGQKSPSDDGKKRVLRARDKTKKLEKGPTSHSKERNECCPKVKVEEDASQKTQSEEDSQNTDKKSQELNAEDMDDTQNSMEFDTNEAERQARTRRGRDAKKRKEDHPINLRNKRPKREIRKSDQQNKEETLLDNEVAKINENNRSFLNKYGNEAAERGATFRGFSEGGRGKLEKLRDNADGARSKSENDLIISKEPGKGTCENRFSRNLSENPITKQENIDILDADCKPVKTPETSQKDSDETSTSGESSSSVNVTPKILETPEDKVKKESILRLLGLESLEKAAERLSHQKAKKEQYTGTLKTVIRLQKEKEKDKRRSRSPLKMVLKQGRGDGEGDSIENFYTIQKEFGSSGWGDSSSGANRKFSTNHRHSCDEDNEEAPPKDRQSLVIPEKSSSFSIHPGRLCADVCCYCFGKFGSLDTPMHLAQMKSDERRKKILNIERHLTNDSCLCDACYRHVDRKANTSPTNMQAKPQKQHRQLMVPKCTARNCRDDGRHHVKRRWLLKIKAGLQKEVDIDWESSQHTSMSFCVNHYSKIERFLTCALCKRRLARNHAHQLSNTETEQLNVLLEQQKIPVILVAGTFVCKLCRYFTQLQLKYKDLETMSVNHKSFFKSYRKRVLHYHHIEVPENEDDDFPLISSTKDKEKEKDKEKDKRKKIKCSTLSKTSTSKCSDDTTNSVSEKSTPEPNKNERTNPETETESHTAKTSSNSNGENAAADVQFFSIESTIEKLKKRKMLDMHLYTTPDVPAPCESPSEVVEILAMDKEVTLTRLPKRPRTSNDITPVVQRLGANPSISVRTLFPGEEEMNLHANIEFSNVREITPQGWEKCATMIQYDRDTKLLWQELQRPYGNQSSFLRHLILLEKYYRSGDLILAPNASRNAINYSTSVQNRLISYEGPEKMDEPIMEPMASEYQNSRRMSGGFMYERDKHSLSSTSTPKPSTAQSTKSSPPRALKLNPGVSIIKKPPPNLQRLNLPSTSAAATITANGTVKRKDNQKLTATAGGKVIQLSESDFKRLQHLKKQKQQLHTEKQSSSSSSAASNSVSVNLKSTTQFQKAQIAAHTQFQKHLRMQQEMLNRQSRSDFEPLICDVRALANENSPTQNVIHNLNLPKSIQVTTKASNQIPILPKIPKSLTVIPQTITRPADK